MTATDPGLVADSLQVLAHHARSFRWATLALPEAVRDDVGIVYAFCRHVDDLADEDVHTEQDRRRADQDLEGIRRELVGEATPRPLVRAVLEVAARHGTPVGALTDLVKGVRSDLYPVRIDSDADLVRYGYLVAGTVGVVMCHVLGARAAWALPHAIDLGVAMQITNICRDVAEDARRGRVYLPTERLERAGVRPEQILDGSVDRDDLAWAVQGLLTLADRYYASARVGLAALPWRSRLATLAALRIYRAIGTRLLRRHGGDPLHGRTIVPWWSKLLHLVRTVALLPTSGETAQATHDVRLHQPLLVHGGEHAK